MRTDRKLSMRVRGSRILVGGYVRGRFHKLEIRGSMQTAYKFFVEKFGEPDKK